MLKDFRPASIEDYFGQTHIRRTIQSYVENVENIPHTLMISGPYGTGKTTLARILAKLAIGDKADYELAVVETNAAAQRGIDDVRRLIQTTRVAPSFGARSRVYIVDELHQLTDAAQNAFLKPLEDTGEHTYWFLCTTEPEKLLGPIRSRCTTLHLSLFSLEDTKALLRRVTEDALSDEVMAAIHTKSGGHARDAVKFAEIAVNESIVDVDELHKAVGYSDHELRQLWRWFLVERRSFDEWSPYTAALLESADRSSQILDQTTDDLFLSGCRRVITTYAQLAPHVAACKRYEISSAQLIKMTLSLYGGD